MPTTTANSAATPSLHVSRMIASLLCLRCPSRPDRSRSAASAQPVVRLAPDRRCLPVCTLVVGLRAAATAEQDPQADATKQQRPDEVVAGPVLLVGQQRHPDGSDDG